MNQNIPVTETPVEEQSQIYFDSHLLNKKKSIIQEFIKNEDESQDCLVNYPNENIHKIAMEQIQVQGRLLLCKSTVSVYFGDTCNDLYHGYGLLIYKSSVLRFYEGHFQNNCKYGYGLEYINGDIYIGKFVNNKPEDENGVFIWGNGDIYHGSFINGMKHGNGKWQSGDQFYSGSWKFNKPEGQGYIKSGLSEYNGDIKNGYKHGQGIQLFNNGDRYDGMYSNGKPQGNGAYAWSNGSIYKGQFKNGLRFGKGIWQYGSQRYEGSYINDKRNGQGAYYWAGGSYYKGTFIEDLRHGFGQMHWDQESYYKGEWVQGIQHGQGQIWDKGKLVEKGYFENGKIKTNEQSNKKIGHDEFNNKRMVHGQPQQMIKMQTQKNAQLLPVPNFEEKKRFNSFHSTRNNYNAQLPKQKKERIVHQSFSEKQNEMILQKKRQINKRYSFGVDRFADRRGLSQAIHFYEKKSNQKNEVKLPNAKSKQKQKTDTKTSLMKIQMYKKVRQQRKSELVNKKIMGVNVLPKSYQGEVMFETQLSPIKWKNFGHFGSH